MQDTLSRRIRVHHCILAKEDVKRSSHPHSRYIHTSPCSPNTPKVQEKIKQNKENKGKGKTKTNNAHEGENFLTALQKDFRQGVNIYIIGRQCLKETVKIYKTDIKKSMPFQEKEELVSIAENIHITIPNGTSDLPSETGRKLFF